jgi:hypothetical protein
VSVVVPIYNTAQWLPAAIASLRRQRLRGELEAILVDDGSTDDSGTVARDYARQSAGVRCVRQANAGLGAARNHGLRLATGRYVGFLDSDDLYPPGGLDQLLAAAGRHDAKIAIGDMHGLPPRQSPPWRRELVNHPYERMVQSIGLAPDLIGNPSPCNKVFDRDFVVAQGARFSEGTAFEDVLFTLPLMLRSDRTVITPRLAYLYRRRGDGSSIMETRGQPAKIMQHLTVIEELMSLSRGADPPTQRAVERWTAYMQLHYAGRAAESMDDDQLDEFCARMATLFKHVPIEATREYAHGVKARLRAVAIYEQDRSGVRLGCTRAPVRVSGEQVYAGGADLERYRPLLELAPVRAELTGLRVAGPVVELRVRGTVPQLRVGADEERTDLVVELDGVPANLAGTAERTSDLLLRCRLAPDRIGSGRHRLRFAVRDGGTILARPTRLRQRTRPVRLPDGRWAWLTRGGGGARLAVAARRPLAGTAAGAVLGPVERGVAAGRNRAAKLVRRAVQQARRAGRYARRLRTRSAG